MKTKLLSLVAAVFALFAYNTGKAQCPANIQYTLGANGYAAFLGAAASQTTNSQYYWFFGSGASSFTATGNPFANFTYTANGVYTVTLVYSIASTCSFVTTQTIQISNVTTSTCNASFTYSDSGNGVVTFTSNSTASSTNITYYWYYGNNTSYSTSSTNTASTTYTSNGGYMAVLFINSGGCTDSTSVWVQVNSAPCNVNASFIYNVSGANVQFTNTSTGTNSSSWYSWNFGNGSFSSQQSPVLTYTAAGSYVVSLTAHTGTACVSTYTALITIAPSNTCNINAAFTYTAGSGGVTNFQSTSTGVVPGCLYTWYFGDGSSPVTNSSGSASHTYNYAGNYNAWLSVINPTTACYDSTNVVVNQSSGACPLHASFSYTAGSGGVINFGDNSTGTSSLSMYLWNFGDGFTSNLASPSHTYASAGTYPVILSIANGTAMNCVSSSTVWVTVSGIPCVANSNFTLVPTNTTTPGYWLAIPAYPWNISSMHWSWGDGGQDTSMYATHTYSAAGTYSICLTVTASCGATATTCYSQYMYKTSAPTTIIHVNVQPPALVNQDKLNTGIAQNAPAINTAVYPNPGNGLFEVKASNISAASSNIIIHNLLGEKIMGRNIFTENGTIHDTIDLSNAPAGIYILTIESGSQVSREKIVIER